MKTIHYYASQNPQEFESEQPNESWLTTSQLTKENVLFLISRYATRPGPYDLIAPRSILFHVESWNIPDHVLFFMPMKDYKNDVSPVATGTLAFHAFPPEDAVEVVIHARRMLPFGESIKCFQSRATN